MKNSKNKLHKKSHILSLIIIILIGIGIIWGIANHYISKEQFIPHVETYMHEQGLSPHKVKNIKIMKDDMGNWNYDCTVYENGLNYQYNYTNAQGNNHIMLGIMCHNSDITSHENIHDPKIQKLKYKPLASDPLWK